MLLRWLVTLFLALPLAFTSLASWSQVSLLKINDYHQDQQLLFDAQLELQLPPRVLDALQHEIPLQFITHIKLNRRDQFFILPYNSELVDIQYVTELRYSRFFQRYSLHNLRNGNIEHFSQLHDALKTLGTLTGFSLANLNQMHSGLHYHIRLKLELSYWTLPAPLFTHALIHPEWRLASAWFELPVQSGYRR